MNGTLGGGGGGSTAPTRARCPAQCNRSPADQARPRKTFLVHPWPPARHQASPRMPPAPKALEMSDKLIDAQASPKECPVSAEPVNRLRTRFAVAQHTRKGRSSLATCRNPVNVAQSAIFDCLR